MGETTPLKHPSVKEIGWYPSLKLLERYALNKTPSTPLLNCYHYSFIKTPKDKCKMDWQNNCICIVVQFNQGKCNLREIDLHC